MEAAEAIALVKGHIEHELLLRNEYLAAENEILKSKLEGRLSFTTAQKVRLAKLGKEIGRRGLKEVGCIVTPDTILRWYRELVAKKFDGSKQRKSAGKKPVKLPARSPNLNAFAERWILSCKSECTRRILVIGEEGVWRAVQEYIAHHHAERPHQGLGNVVPAGWPGDVPSDGRIECHERLGGLLKSYRRVA